MTATGAELPPEGTPCTPAKLDPETLVLRTKPPRALRFKRGAIIALAACAAAGIASTAWYALEPHSFRFATRSDNTDDAVKPADALAALPTSYEGVPKLGPALPGDLGRPILDHQRQIERVPTGATPGAGTANLAEARERALAQVKAARESGLLVQTSRPMEPIGLGTAAMTATSAPGQVDKLALDPEHDPNAQQRKADFVRNVDQASDINPYPLRQAPSAFTLSAGSVISASLITGLRSDLPGLVTAQVTERTFDSATGRILLIPQGARLLGSYDSVIAFGQRRALVVWQRIVFPDGSSIRLDNAATTDPAGYAGLADRVDFHTWGLLKGVALSTLLGVGAELQFNSESDLVQALRQSTQQSMSQAGGQLTAHNLQVQPTITIRPGTPVRLLVHRDLILKPWKESE